MKTPFVNVMLILVLIVALSSPAAAQSDWGRFEIFGGYSYLPADGNDFPRKASSGFQASITTNLNRWFGVVGDFGAHFNTTSDLGFNYPAEIARTSVYEYLIGPRFAARTRVATIFAHALVGGVTGRTNLRGFADSGLTFGGGGGLTVPVHRHVGVRAQFEVLGSFADVVEGNSRLGVGAVIPLGGL